MADNNEPEGFPCRCRGRLLLLAYLLLFLLLLVVVVLAGVFGVANNAEARLFNK